ncbi:NAD(P)H-dependent oxidoreductase [Candidatus Falkowbacteria bacterium]|uniref:NADPH:quinone reductase n=1 Tax=Candidatus Falkowbacteria bacterium CG10_big_fil_rev_8_21_14_0_10_37_18 TaxID=1974562 RepID=A0A2H0V8N8_9BACT|nr:NAD(P)H-dependent oxidoreductase [Candidatus Falkowbacteria bacterium]NCQ12767.1 NAD(P)H-dependent oxidoreductase [Candidatus Falkowbacteria bacterium]OIO06145.1 MAG: hypothetical protein AUJ26_01415 [Candidatus Falkowbacteria bacterium CG1_02_37_21]PIR95448.1 MAG: NADPH:quinone reductase [Candidatus Falkowbacteria bacterium CG10_big_fil_rev_8_21_14_0_10_37_18]
MKKILIIKTHTRDESFCNALTDKYIAGAREAKNEIEIINLKDLSLEPWLKYGHNAHDNLKLELFPDLLQAQKLILWSDHIVFSYPTYWSAPPALLKIFFETILTPGFAYKYHKSFYNIIPCWDKLLKGRTATIISTMDSPAFFTKFLDPDAGGKMMRSSLSFVGIKLKKKYYFGSVRMSNDKKKQARLTSAYEIGKRIA